MYPIFVLILIFELDRLGGKTLLEDKITYSLEDKLPEDHKLEPS